MDKDRFAHHLTLAAYSTLAFTRTLCWNRLADPVDFVIRPDNLDDHAPYLSPLEWARFQERKRELGRRFTAAEVVERLWVAQQVPAFINISVAQAGYRRTTLELLIDWRLRPEGPELFHAREGYPPFHVAVPTPPYARGPHPRFHSNWQRWPWRIQLILWRSWWAIRYRLSGSFPK
jgi:hypothetical protein